LEETTELSGLDPCGGQVESLDEFVYIICRGHLEITSIVAPYLGTLQESYAIHRSAWKWNSANFRFRGFWEDEMRRPTPIGSTLSVCKGYTGSL
jgi:hypothetical protein